MTVKVTEAILERHMSKVDFLQGQEISSLDPEKLMELSVEAKKSRIDMIQTVFDADPVYADFAKNISSAASESIKIALITSLAKGGGLTEVENLIRFIMIDSLIFSYNILQDCISESWWERQVNMDDKTKK